MLYYDKTGVSAGIDINKTSAWKECHICHYWYFIDKRFKFQPYVYNDINLCDIGILNICDVDYCRIIDRISKSDAVNLLQNAGLTEKKRSNIKIKKINTK